MTAKVYKAIGPVYDKHEWVLRRAYGTPQVAALAAHGDGYLRGDRLVASAWGQAKIRPVGDDGDALAVATIEMGNEWDEVGNEWDEVAGWSITSVQQVAWAVLCAASVHASPAFQAWASAWVRGERSTESAAAALADSEADAQASKAEWRAVDRQRSGAETEAGTFSEDLATGMAEDEDEARRRLVDARARAVDLGHREHLAARLHSAAESARAAAMAAVMLATGPEDLVVKDEAYHAYRVGKTACDAARFAARSGGRRIAEDCAARAVRAK